jgi:hypothetical protein
MRFTKQPTFPAKIDRGNPITNGLVFAALPLGNSFVDVVSGQVAVNVGASRYRNCVDGNRASSLSFIGPGSGAAAKFPNPTGLDFISGSFSVFCEASLEVNATTQDIFKSWETGGGKGLGIAMDDGSVVFDGWFGRVDNSNSNFGPGNSGILGSNSEQTTHRIAIAADGSSRFLYGAGKLQNTITSSTMPSASANRRTYMLNGFDPTSSSSSGSVALLVGWSRAITESEYKELFYNPWQIFSFSKRGALFAPTSAAAAFTAS